MYPYNKYLIQSYLLLIITIAGPCETGYDALKQPSKNFA